jgi:hypothetical protein
LKLTTQRIENPDTRYVDCEVHGPHRKAYFVCHHILHAVEGGTFPKDAERCRKLIVTHIPWRDDPDHGGGGELICALGGSAHTVNDIDIVCEDTLLDCGILLRSETSLM